LFGFRIVSEFLLKVSGKNASLIETIKAGILLKYRRGK
jgi:hypothetical protein